MDVSEIQRCPGCGRIVSINGLSEDLDTEFKCGECGEIYPEFEEAEECCTEEDE
jgi:predicted RNA-binding Zn-ribbon protein involved in translation (DUF1610 family)